MFETSLRVWVLKQPINVTFSDIAGPFMWQWCTKENAPTVWEWGWPSLCPALWRGWDKLWLKRPKSQLNRCSLLSVLDAHNTQSTLIIRIMSSTAPHFHEGSVLLFPDCPNWNVLRRLSSLFLWRRWRPWDHSGEWLHLCLWDTRAI